LKNFLRAIGVLLLLHGGSSLRAEELRVMVLDVGEGQSVYVQSGKDSVLVDVGPIMSAGTVVDFVAQQKSQLEAIVLTHLHPDHASAFFRMREAFEEVPVFHTHHPAGLAHPIDSVRWVAEALEKDPNAPRLLAGDELSFEGFTLRALWPELPLSEDLNQSSIVLAIDGTDGQRYALMMGDVGVDVENRLMQQGLVHSYPLLVAGHHASRQTSSEQFLSQVGPAHVAVSINANNRRGYPDPSTLQRFADSGAHVWITAQDGDLCFSGFELGRVRECSER
jgi:competence protein ComEC